MGLALLISPAFAQNWNGNSNGLWSNSANWTGSAPTSSGTLGLTFDTANLTGAGLRTTTNDLTSFTASSLTFSSTTGSSAFSLNGNAITLGGNLNVTSSAGFPATTLGLDLTLNGNRVAQVEAGASTVITGSIGETGGSRSLSKRGTGLLTLSSANSFSGGLNIGNSSGSGESNFGGTVILGHNSAGGTGTIIVQNTGSSLFLGNGVTISNTVEVTNLGLVKTLGLQQGATSGSIGGNVSLADVWNENEIRVFNGGTLNLAGNISGTGFFTSGRGTVISSGTNTLSSSAGVFLGTLRLNYTTNNTSKLGDSGALTLAGALELTGGSHNEIVGSTTVNPGASSITRTSGTSTISLGTITFNQGSTLNFASASIATLNTGTAFGTSPNGWATLGGTDWAVASTTGTGVSVVALSTYTGVSDGGNLANSSSNNNLLTNGGSIGLAAVTTATNTVLLKSGTDAVINTAGRTLQTRGLMIAQGGGNLTVGTAPNSGSLTRFGTSGFTQLSLINYSTNTLTVNAQIVDQTGPVAPFVTKSGSGLVVLAANNAYIGTTFVNEGTLLLSGSNTGNGAYEVRGNLMVNGSVGSGTVTVYDGATLGGEGTIGGATVLQQGGNLAPGYNSAETLTFTNGLNLSATAGSTGAFAFTLGTASDLVDVTGGTLNLGDGLLNFSSFTFTLGPGFTAQNYTLFSSVSTSGSLAFDNLSGDLGGGFTGLLGLSGQDVVLSVSVIPEPGSLLLLCMAGVFFWFRRIRTCAAPIKR